MTATSELTNRTSPAPGRVAVKPELLAPAGDRTCLVAAIENGADAVYFGLQGHNARARAANFDEEALVGAMALLHRRGVKGYVALNTLIFPGELEDVEQIVRRVAIAGVDAVIVQDLGLARLIRAVTPDLEIHASTQMSITGPAGIALARDLGCSRVILARELTLAEIGRIQAEPVLPVEVFVHGALCVSYSGQCLTSEALGGRSANRGECAQACRLPYEVVVDGEVRDLGEQKYLLSPRDLAAHDLVPRLIELGVASLKIEGRLKSPEYVANITRHYREAIDSAWAGRPIAFAAEAVREMELSFSRGFGTGFLGGIDHKELVRGDYAKKRGVFVGRVESVRGDAIRVELAAPVKRGDGLVLDADDSSGAPEQGGRLYDVARPAPRGRPATPPPEGGLAAGPAELKFSPRDLDARRVRVGQRVWKTDDPELTRRLRKTFEGPPRRLVDLDLRVRAAVGGPVRLAGTTPAGHRVEVGSDEPLAPADRAPATPELLREQLGRLGGTGYQLRHLDADLGGGPLIPKSTLNTLRRALVEALDRAAATPRPRMLADAPVLPSLRPDPAPAPAGPAELIALCRTTRQIEAALGAGLRTIYADFQDIKGYADAVAAVRGGPASIYLATPRIEKPGEAPLFRNLAKREPDGFLARNAGGIAFCADRGIPFVADYTMNAANELTVDYLKAKGALRVTASYDLDAGQLDDLLAASPAGAVEVVIHQQIPMFHMEHCVFCAVLSPGTDATNCGRPCDVHDVTLRDRVGKRHPLKADVGCRNTLYNATPQTAAEYLPALIARGVRHLRVEFLDDDPAAVRRTLALYADALAGRRDAASLWRDLKASGRYGVTRGPLAIL